MPVSNSELFPFLREYGRHSMAYTSLEPDFKYFLLEGVGYIAYITYTHWLYARKARQIVLADPVCDSENYSEIVDRFVEQFPDVIFVQSSKHFAKVLDEKAYQVNQFGIETEILIDGFNLKGKLRAKLRQWRNKCEREDVEVKELSIEQCQNVDEIKALSQTWLDKKGGAEFSFLVRPLRFEKEIDVRYFWAFKDNKLIAFATFDPMYSKGNIVGYYHNIDRLGENAPHGTSALIVLKAIEVFEQENIEFVSLGMSPLYLQRGMALEFNHHHFTRKAFWYAFEKLNFLYPFKGNASHKNKFNGVKKPVYISSTNGTGLIEVFRMMKAIGML